MRPSGAGDLLSYDHSDDAVLPAGCGHLRLTTPRLRALDEPVARRRADLRFLWYQNRAPAMSAPPTPAAPAMMGIMFVGGVCKVGDPVDTGESAMTGDGVGRDGEFDGCVGEGVVGKLVGPGEVGWCVGDCEVGDWDVGDCEVG